MPSDIVDGKIEYQREEYIPGMPMWAQRVDARRLRWQALALPLLLIIAASLRLFNLNWDNGQLFHPDERHILMVTEGIRLPWPINFDQLLTPASPLNPRSFAYGSLIFYMLRIFQTIVEYATSGLTPASPDSWLQPGLGGLRFTGRALSAFFDTGTVYVTYLLGRRLYSARIGLLAATFITFSVINIQLSHFYASDTPMTFFVMLTLYLSARRVTGGSRANSIWAGVTAGLAMACKISAAPVLAAVAMSNVLRVVLPSDESSAETGLRRRISLSNLSEINRGLVVFAISLFCTLIVFLVTQPYVVIDFRTFISNVTEQNNMARGVSDLPYTRQYIDRPAFWYYIENLALFGVGLPLGIAMFAGWIYVILRSIRNPRRSDLLLLVFVIPYFLITGTFYAKFMRYLLPITPVLALFAAVGLLELRAWAQAIADRLAAKRATVAPATVPVTVTPPTYGYATPPGEEARSSAAAWRPTEQPANESVAIPPASKPRLGVRGFLPAIATGLVGFVIIASGLYSLAYESIYANEHPAVAASRWLYANAPRGSTLAREHWEEGLPVGIIVDDGLGRRQMDPGQMQYRQAELPMYENDDERKLGIMASTLARTDYLLFFSNRLYGTIPRLAERYPMSKRYYELLFSEQLGFELVNVSTNYPRLGPIAFVDDTFSDPRLPIPMLIQNQTPALITINLGRADESFSVYDHPKVLIFKKVQRLTEADYRAALQPSLTGFIPGARPQAPVVQTTYPSLELTREQALRQQAGGTFSELFDRFGFANQFPVLVWVLALIVIGLAAYPLSVSAFAHLTDRGLPLARGLGLLLMTWITWISVAVVGVPAGRVMTYVGLILLIAIGVVMFRRNRGELIRLFREQRAIVIGGELAFWIPFFYFVAVRMANPDLWHAARGGEKPMDLAYLMAAIKSTSFPPYDPWFAGGFLNYYYFGQIIVGNLTKLTGVIPTTAYNLLVPTLYAMTFAGAYSVAVNFIARITPGKTGTILAGGAASGLFVTTLGNLGGAGQIGMLFSQISGIVYQSLIPGLQYVVLTIAGVVSTLLLGRQVPIPSDWYWGSTRILQGTINEFPYFTFLYADLHAHMIGLPFTMIAIALAVNLFLSRTREPVYVPVARRAMRFAAEATMSARSIVITNGLAPATKTTTWSFIDAIVNLAVSGLVIGALWPINSWDFPTYLGLISAAGMAPWYFAPKRSILGFIGGAVRVALVALLSFVLYIPFRQNFVSFYSGVKPTPEQSDVGGYLVIHGFFLSILLSYFAIDCMGAIRRTGFGRSARAFAARWDRLPQMLSLRRTLVRKDDGSGTLILWGAAGLVAIAVAANVLGYTLAGILIALLIPMVGRLLSRPRSPESTFVLLLTATGLALGIFSEIVAIDGDVGRMNTVFKLYLQVWTMWGIASAIALVLMREHLGRIRVPGFRRWWASAILVLFISASMYPIIATKARTSDRFDTSIPPTLDGTAYMETATYREDAREALRPAVLKLADDRRAIEWIWDNVRGSPVIAEANTPLYRWGSRISIYTGLPTIIGWDWHQTQQRWGFRSQIEERMRDVRVFFGDPGQDRVRGLIAKYNVQYVYVGGVERAYYSAEGLRKFDDMVGTSMDLVYDQDGVKIYRVREASS